MLSYVGNTFLLTTSKKYAQLPSFRKPPEPYEVTRKQQLNPANSQSPCAQPKPKGLPRKLQIRLAQIPYKCSRSFLDEQHMFLFCLFISSQARLQLDKADEIKGPAVGVAKPKPNPTFALQTKKVVVQTKGQIMKPGQLKQQMNRRTGKDKIEAIESASGLLHVPKATWTSLDHAPPAVGTAGFP